MKIGADQLEVRVPLLPRGEKLVQDLTLQICADVATIHAHDHLIGGISMRVLADLSEVVFYPPIGAFLLCVVFFNSCAEDPLICVSDFFIVPDLINPITVNVLFFVCHVSVAHVVLPG